jgi:ribose-phosphate pyrophosphokinase
LFLGRAPERLAAIPQISEVVTTDTVPQSPEEWSLKKTVLTTAPVFGGAIWQNYFHRSIGELFDFGQKNPHE